MSALAVGADLLVRAGLCSKASAGRYDLLVRGEQLYGNLARSIASLVKSAVAPRIDYVERNALRPGPRQLLAFHVVTFAAEELPGTGSGAVRTALLKVSELLWDWNVENAPFVTSRGLQLRQQPRSDRPTLRHTLAAADFCEGDRGLLTIGLAPITVALLDGRLNWPSSLAPEQCEVVCARRYKADLLAEFESALASESISFRVRRASEAQSPFPPVVAVLTSGIQPILLRLSRKRYRVESVEQALRAILEELSNLDSSMKVERCADPSRGSRANGSIYHA